MPISETPTRRALLALLLASTTLVRGASAKEGGGGGGSGGGGGGGGRGGGGRGEGGGHGADDGGGDGGGDDNGAGADHGASRELSADDARSAVSRGEMVPLARIITTARAAKSGDIVGISLVATGGQRLVYRVVVLDQGYRRWQLAIDARYNRVLSMRPL